jgi:hypothetical protein
MRLSLNEIKQIIVEAIEEELWDEIVETSEMPEFSSIESFAEYLFDDERTTYTFVELSALALNVFAATSGVSKSKMGTVPRTTLHKVAEELTSYGLRGLARGIPGPKVRGVQSPIHGSNRYAGNAGGAGISPDWGTASGKGLGAIGGGRDYEPNGRDLPMGSRRR